MSQQHINDQEIKQDEARFYTDGYGESPRQRGLFSTYGEKVSTEKKGELYLIVFRWLLAVISLILWLVAFYIAMNQLVALATYHFFSDDNFDTIQTFIIYGFVGFTALILVINILFNRKR